MQIVFILILSIITFIERCYLWTIKYHQIIPEFDLLPIQCRLSCHQFYVNSLQYRL
jgi:hypothetical protein